MSTFFSIFNLALHRVAARDATRPYLGGVYVDPSKGVTMASDGKRLVEITCPAVEKFPTPKGVTLANGEAWAKPFIIPADVAQRLLKSLPKSAKPGDPKAHAALVAPQKGAGGKVSIVSGDGTTMSFSPIDATFPDVSKANIFPAKEPKVSLIFNHELLGDTAKAAALGQHVKLHVFDDRIVIESDAEGVKARAALMAVNGEAKYEPAGKADSKDPENPEADPAPDPETEVEEVGDVEHAPESGDPDPAHEPESHTTSGSAGSNGYRRPWNSTRRRDEPSGPPTATQRAFHTYLIRTRGGTLSPEHLHEEDISAEIEDLKEVSATTDVAIATWRQWKKIFLLLAERKADDAKVCATLNGLRDIGQTSDVIDALLKKAA